jgi:hypothetical protein
VRLQPLGHLSKGMFCLLEFTIDAASLMAPADALNRAVLTPP